MYVRYYSESMCNCDNMGKKWDIQIGWNREIAAKFLE